MDSTVNGAGEEKNKIKHNTQNAENDCTEIGIITTMKQTLPIKGERRRTEKKRKTNKEREKKSLAKPLGETMEESESESVISVWRTTCSIVISWKSFTTGDDDGDDDDDSRANVKTTATTTMFSPRFYSPLYPQSHGKNKTTVETMKYNKKKTPHISRVRISSLFALFSRSLTLYFSPT